MAGSRPYTGAEMTPAVVLRNKKTLAKTGMAVALGALVATGLMNTDRKPAARRVHLLSGAALVGFSLWHVSLYNKTRGRSG